MAQNNGRLERSLYQDILHAIAEDPTPHHCVPTILHAAQKVSAAQAAFFIIFDQPRVVLASGVEEAILPPDADLLSVIEKLSEDIHVTSNLPQTLEGNYAGWVIAPIRSHEKNVSIFCLLFSELVELSDELTESLASLVDGLKVITSRARLIAYQEKLNRNQHEFIRIVSHDLRSPLTSIQGFASMMESSMVGELNEKQAHFVSKILSGIEQMSSFVDNVQDAGRYDPETGFYEMERTACDLLEMVHGIVNNYLVPAEKQELTVMVNTSDDVPIVYVDQNMIQRAIINLVDNAIKYTPNGGKIQVGVKRVDDEVVIAVSDNGFGISEEHQKKLFERYFRIRRQEHKRVKGGGLGLFIVRSVAQRHGGRAWIESKEGQGSTFAIGIPLKGANLVGTAEV